jgi:hypothetical protein
MAFLIRTSTVQAENVIRSPVSSAALGGIPTQITGGARLNLTPDEAVIVTASDAGALFRDAVLTDAFWMTFNYWDHQSSLVAGQMAPDADGRFTYVVAHRDPGVHNWLDTCGNDRVKLGHRWQAFDRNHPSEMPTLSGRKVKFADLEKELPQGVRRIDPAGRKAQIALRQEGFRKRFIDS